MKRKNTRRKVLALTLSLAMVACATLSLSTTAKAEDGQNGRIPSSDTEYSDYGEYVGSGRTATQDKLDGDTSNVLNVPVQARVVGEGDIVYFVSIVPGAMKFEYSYGSKWDPVNHKYDTSSGSSGWGIDYVDGSNPSVGITNNNIHVINGSTFPIVASFKYEDNGTFGNAPTGYFNVGGIFSSTRGTLVTEVTKSNTNPTTYDPNNQYRTATLPLEMYIDTNEVAPGTGYYYKTYDNQLGKNEGDMYFALVGTPARNLQSTFENEFKDVGTITVTITPDSLVTSATT